MYCLYIFANVYLFVVFSRFCANINS